MKKQKGYTLAELLIVLAFFAIVSLAGTAILVACHFISKWW